MGLWDKLAGELVDIVEWLDPDDGTVVQRFARHQNEIKHGAKLTVREGQMAVFVNEGRIADVFAPGMYTLVTANLPILSTLKGWMHGFNSPFKAEVYFVATRLFTDRKWGTRNPLILRDAEFGMVRLRAFGSGCLRVVNAETLVQKVVGSDGVWTLGDFDETYRNLIAAAFPGAVAAAGVPLLDLAAHYGRIATEMHKAAGPTFAAWGLELSEFRVENISLPPEVEALLDKRTGMGALGDLNRFTQFQAATAIPIAAANPGGGVAAAAMGAGLGFGMGAQMAAGFPPPMPAPAAPAMPPPLPAAPAFHVALDGQQAGPFAPAQLQQLAAAGRLRPDTLVWRAGLAGWLPAAQVPDLAGLIPPAPPALPR
jgi:membrane protease subunit (stomatin/prohibitin family)